jgi:uncharacterized protein (TIGR00661 family)
VKENQKKKILFAILNWGIGHATRCVPLIEAELKKGNHVYFASNGAAEAFLKQRFSDLICLSGIPDYAVTYPRSGKWMAWHLFAQGPKIYRAIEAEHQWLQTVQEVEKFDLIISDNRYGCYVPKVHSVFITHQLQPIAPWPLRLVLHTFLRRKMQHFQQIWVPDYAEKSKRLSGRLSHYRGIRWVRFIGPLSRFEAARTSLFDCKEDVLVVLSGPEPQRTLFEESVIRLCKMGQLSALVVAGRPHETETWEKENIRYVSHLNDEDLKAALLQAPLVVCRSGYSTLMDLECLERHSVLVPTPGQTEQVYLAKKGQEYGHVVFEQSDLEQPETIEQFKALAQWGLEG